MKKKGIIITLLTIAIILILVTFSYAYWRLTYTATKVNKIISSCFSMELTNEKNNIVLDDAYPITDEKGKSLTPYSFTITNTCDLFASYIINLEILEGTTLNSKYIKTMINNEAITNLNTLETTDPSIDGATESRILFNGSLGSGDSVDYTLRLWMDSETPFNEDSMNKIFQAKITVTGEVSTYSPVENGFTNLADALLVNEYQTTSLSIAKDRISSKQEVDFTKTAPIIEWKESKAVTPTALTVTKANDAEVGNCGVVENATKMLLGKSYTFDSKTGYYTLKDTDYYKPDEVDYSTNDYYFCSTSLNVKADGTLGYHDFTSCAVLNNLISVEQKTNGSITLSSGVEVTTDIYKLSVYKMSETELESDKSDKGLYGAIDDYGTTYYYRGNVSNNYVKFAGFYWRVIRINGDESIRLLYAGTTISNDPEVTIGNGLFNNNKNDPTYVGYMYSNTINTSYEDTISNDNNSAIKTKLDTWYKTNIEDAGYSTYIADSGFCNDRSIASNSNGDGVSSLVSTLYTPKYRINNSMPSFICPNPENDLFTLAGNEDGNQDLLYPIGLITADEVAFAGMAENVLNKLSFVYSKSPYWTMSPLSYYESTSAANNFFVSLSGSISANTVNTSSYAVRPVINLKSTTEISGGIGTKNDPFIIK